MVKFESLNPDDILEKVKTSISFCDLARNLGMDYTKTHGLIKLKKFVKERADSSHFPSNSERSKIIAKRINDTDILKKDSVISAKVVKSRLLKLIDYKCSECGIVSWCETPLVLQMDHINGVPNDNRVENLRLLCPNCHSQTATFISGKKGLLPKKPQNICLNCGSLCGSKSTYCWQCHIDINMKND